MSSFQRQVLRTYTALALLRPQWGGSLVLGCGLDESGAALALAANIAGAVFLSIEPDAERVKAAQRSGACDFAVNTLDEALRTMKNEVRQGRALSVGLLGDTAVVLAEVIERGLQPVIAADFSGGPGAGAAMLRLQAMGVELVCFAGGVAGEGATDAEALVEEWAVRLERSLRWVCVARVSDLSALDGALRALVTPEDRLRMRWLERAGTYFRRELGRAIWLNESETAEMRAAGREVLD